MSNTNYENLIHHCYEFILPCCYVSFIVVAVRPCCVASVNFYPDDHVAGVRDASVAMVYGKLNRTVECNPILGPAAFDAVEKATSGQTLPKKTIVQDKLYDQTTAKDVIASRKY